MFLNRLDLREKQTFISLAFNGANINGIVAEEELQMIEEYCKEMDIVLFDSANIKSIDEVIAIFSISDDEIKKIVLLELLGLMYADGDFDDVEKEFVIKVANGIGVSDEKVSAIQELMVKYIDVTRELLGCIENS